MINTQKAFLGISILFLCISTTTAKENLSDQWKKESDTSFRENLSMLLMGEFEATVEDASGKKIKTVNFKTDGENKVVSYFFEDELKEVGQNAKKTIVIGPAKTFRMSLQDDGKFQALRANISNSEGDGVLSSVASFVFLPASPLGSKSLIQAESENIIQLIEIKPHNDHEVMVSYKFQQSGTVCRSRFDRNLNWMVTSVEFDSADGTPYRRDSVHYSEWDKDKNLLRYQVEEEFAKSNTLEKDSVSKVIRTSLEKADPNLFTLEHYGLPGNLGDSLGFNWSLLFSAVILCLVCLLGITMLLKR